YNKWTEVVMANLKNILCTYLSHRHIDLMPPDVVDRFEDYKKNVSFIGHMSDWNKLYYGQPIKILDDTVIKSAEDWEKFYDSCQSAFQQMYEGKNHSVGIGKNYNPATIGFIDRWFGPSANKTFTYAKASDDTKDAFTALANFLETHKSDFKPRFTTQLASVFSDITYEDFCKDVKDGKYNTNIPLRKKIETVIDHIRAYGPKQNSDPDNIDNALWPRNVGYVVNNVAGINVCEPDPVLLPILYDPDPAVPPPPHSLDLDPDKWYEIKDKTDHIDWFKTDYIKIFDEILTNSVIREKFLEKAGDPIASALRNAIADTDYENKESDDYVPPELLDSKNWRQKIKKWKDDTYENHFRRFVEPSRGTRVYFSPHSQNIMKGFDKAGIKPTDGLDGILNKKGDAKLQNIVQSDPNTRKHFDWFTKKLEELKKETPDDFEGALRDGRHLQKLVINLIIKASKENKLNEAMTALEVLSVAKYGLMSSRTFNSIYEATKNLKIFSDPKLSWNKGVVQNVSNVVDQMIALMIRGSARVGMGVRNFVSHRRTKIGNIISKYDNLNDAYKEWDKEDRKRHGDIAASNAAHDVPNILAQLNNPARSISAGSIYETQVQINPANIKTIRAALDAAIEAGHPHVVIPGIAMPIDTPKLKNDVELFEDVNSRSELETNWREKNPDIIHDLVAYWDMLETFGKTHKFRLGSMKVKRNEMLENFDLKKKTSRAQTEAWQYINNYGGLSYSP
ncbi:MAG: hypothetical protein J6W79_02335, partial [Alphaproteobacteria bacterium]|nr:hypothetical protein [Alphaproteobacteria bacterium]